ncbi:lysophospholipid acyltransferase family protein [Microbacterium oleivorans]|uniref:1-acyl-sn-glycerol-3-phosphate acyltransferase n=1 Tax=Microbacterium oleivorans TaxID=273677 RepID=A0A7D5F5Y2_9MICO|nr:lysophospholipid acyltransferase family protein [Microbacterium oleivorans]QLD10973.1 1-acyl-sn-glycerol-3-phosphate acyltransferase [Microbacterium oleivorans]
MSSRMLRAGGAVYFRHIVGQSLTTARGLDHLRAHGAFVLVCNHTSYLDHFVLTFALEAMREGGWWFLTKKESFDDPLARRWTRAWNGIPVDRERMETQTVREVRRRLGEGDVVCVYPEGTRGSDSRRMRAFRPGAFHFAVSEGVPIVPAVIVGAEAVLPKGRLRPRKGRIDLQIGPPLTADAAGSQRDRAARLAAVSRAWMQSALDEVWTRRAGGILGEIGVLERVVDLRRRGMLVGARRRSLELLIRGALTGVPVSEPEPPGVWPRSRVRALLSDRRNTA